jgi:hypothetical protein
MYFLSACSLFKKSEKNGCPTDGRNVGAEKLLSDDKKNAADVKAASKAKYRIKGKN